MSDVKYGSIENIKKLIFTLPGCSCLHFYNITNVKFSLKTFDILGFPENYAHSNLMFCGRIPNIKGIISGLRA
ncbi:hypothetical protein SAMN05216302_100222 [Nitrosomonas aestuarii]|uniref:Uncharacterized protein n=1 Tax=Nitrosomonas aestuarii TaxID=52441 RepID=A0A1I3XPQ5_9PROT|nr:hypothetical protein SAMN05216302_100222 [Nitrosomonas aestuarii]